MRDVLGEHERGYEMMSVARFAAMRTKNKRIEIPLPSRVNGDEITRRAPPRLAKLLLPQVIQRCHIGVHVVEIVRVGRIRRGCPLVRRWGFLLECVGFRFAFVVDAIQTDHLRE